MLTADPVSRENTAFHTFPLSVCGFEASTHMSSTPIVPRSQQKRMWTEIHDVPREDALRMGMQPLASFRCLAPHQKRFSWDDARAKGFLQPKFVCRVATAVVRFRGECEDPQEADPCTSGGIAPDRAQATCQPIYNVPNVRVEKPGVPYRSSLPLARFSQ